MSYVYKPPGSKCVFAGCNANKRDSPERIFFKFPFRNDDLCRQWVENCANEQLHDLTRAQLQYQHVCDRHFTRSCFTSDMRTRLEKNAIPTLLDQDIRDVTITSVPSTVTSTNQTTASSTSSTAVTIADDSQPSTSVFKTHPPSSHDFATEIDFQSTPEKMDVSTNKLKTPTILECKRLIKTPPKSKHDEDTPRKIKIKKSLVKYKKSLRRRTLQFKRLQTKHIAMTPENIFKAACSNIQSNSFHTLLHMQMLHKQGTQWQEDEKKLAIEMFYRSPALYDNLRDDKAFNLPARKTISRWVNVINLMPGICDELLDMLKLKVKNMHKLEKQVTLLFDEMSIKRCLQYNEKRDIIEGFEDLGSLGRTQQLGDHVLMFLVRGLIYRWKMPVAYYISSSNVSGDVIANLLQVCIDAVTKAGLNIRAVVCDQGSNNRKAASTLQVSENRPYFIHHGNKIYFIYDTPHLIKSIRNSLLTADIMHNGVWAKWDYIVKLYDIDVGSNMARSLCKLTPKHVAPNPFDKMKVKLATQVFSHSVYAALMTAVETSQLPQDAADTATFVRRLNDVFDCLNSRVQFDANPLRCGVSSNQQGMQVINTLQSALTWLETWKREKKTTKSHETPPCFSGLKMTITAVLQMWDDLKEDGVTYLLTNRLTQDPLENEFSIARQRCGYGRNPSAMQFRQNLRHRIHIVLMKPPDTSNCEIDDDQIAVGVSDSEGVTDTEGEDDEDDDDDPADHIISVPEVEMVEDYAADSEDSTDGTASSLPSSSQPSVSSHPAPATLESCSVQYVAGYLAKVCISKFNCEQCKDELVIDAVLGEENELLILFKSYATKEGVSHLTAPSPVTVAVTDLALSIFATEFPRLKHRPHLKSTLVDLVREQVSYKYGVWLKDGSECQVHREFFINFLIRLKIFKTILWISRELKVARYKTSSQGKMYQKLKNIQHM